MNKAFLIALSGVLTSLSAQASLESVTISSQDHFPAPRWMYGIGEFPKTGLDATTTALGKVKEAQLHGNDQQCTERAHAAKPKAKSLQAWLSVVELECASRIKPSLKAASLVSQALEDIVHHPDWFVVGPQTSRLRGAFSAGLLNLIDQDLKVNRARAWKSIERVDEFANVIDEKTRALAWRSAGDLSVIQLKPEAAHDFYKRSLALTESPETRDRLQKIDASLGLTRKPETTPTPEPSVEAAPVALGTVNGVNEATPEELELASRATVAFKSGDVVVAIDMAVKLIRADPGGTRAKWATDRVQETLNSFAEKTDIKYQDIHDQILSRVEEADADRLVEWARVLYNRAQFPESLRLAKKAVGSIDGAKRTKALELMAQAALANEEWSTARSGFNELIDKSAGQPASRDALFRLSLLNYREQKYSEAISGFERLLALPQIENLEVGSRYWLWRALQKTKSERSDRAADDLMTRFPFSYYGLRARLEQGKGTLEWKSDPLKDKTKVESVMWLTSSEKMSWEKTQILLKAGWVDEAQSELRELPPPVKAEDKAVRALLYAAAGGYVTASKLANEAWDERPELRRSPFTDAAFPKEFSEFIEAQSTKRNLDRNLVRGLIKQESSYNVKAISSSNAYGLMQMIPPTAREIAQDLKIPGLKLPDDMFQPKRNIEMGTYYLSRMVTRNDGNIPLALANYNAGPARMDRWLRSRPSLKTLPSSKSSAADDEIWIDEIPYSETCFYVKAILRNIMLYRLLDQGRVVMPDPIWSRSN